MKVKNLIQLALVLLMHHVTYSQKLIVGEEVRATYNSPHPARGALRSNEIVWSQDIVYTANYASYLAVHFDKLNLNEGDKLVLSSPDNSRIWEYTSKDNNRGSFWSIPINGNTIKIEIKSSAAFGSYGYSIDKIARGLSQQEIQEVNGIESICGTDDTKEAKCYLTSEPEVYGKSRAVARLLLNGSVHCTGFLVGSEGHLMTCEHCIENSIQANNISVEMMAEGSDCSVNCKTAGGCPGTIVASSVTLLQNNPTLDYALVKLPTNVSSTYGYLRLSPDAPYVNERIYIPQHPAGWGKRIAVESDNNFDDPDGVVHVFAVNTSDACTSSSVKFKYYGDTRGGSSGSPVIDYANHTIVGVHGCGGCPNSGAMSNLIVDDLDYIPENGVAGPCQLGNLIVTSNMTINQNQTYRNIIIKPNATLTIDAATVEMSNTILVEMGGKLVLNGGKLTNCQNGIKWKGIKVSADLGFWWFAQPTTIVEVKNGGIIENADVAIDAVGQITFLTTSNVGGAKILINTNSIIRNCEYGVKLGPIYGVQEQSIFSNAQFTNLEWAINLDNNHGLNIKSCQFSQNYYDIEALTSSLKADNNDFNGGVVFENTFPNFTGSTFTNNRFYDGGVGGSGILLDAFTNATDFNIHNNQFFETGVLSLGELDFDIQSNDFHGSPEGTWINDSGLDITNDIYRNKFYDNTYGNSASGVNSVEYLKNCFENTAEFSIEVNEGASIELQQGEFADAAGNCFFASGRVGTGTTSEFFEYYVKSEEIPQSCKKPGSGNFAEKQANVDNPFPCGTGINIYGTLPYIVRNCMYGNGISKQQAINLLKAEILRLQKATNINPWTKRWLIAKYKKCLDRLIKQKAKEDKDQRGRESAVQFLLSQPEFRYQSMAYGLVVESGDITRSRTMLSNLRPSDDGETEFVQSQHTLLDYLSDRAGYKPSNVTLSSLYNAGLRKHPLAGFSRSVYHTLSGQKVPVTLTHLSGRSQTRIKEAPGETFFYPNPSYEGNVTIDIPDYDHNYEYSYSIQSTSGGCVNKGTLSQKVNELSLNIPSGLYFVTLLKNGKPMLNQKWVVIR